MIIVRMMRAAMQRTHQCQLGVVKHVLSQACIAYIRKTVDSIAEDDATNNDYSENDEGSYAKDSSESEEEVAADAGAAQERKRVRRVTDSSDDEQGQAVNRVASSSQAPANVRAANGMCRHLARS
eukprot:3821309-Pleurochrysis_carterae.AAC.1